MDWRVMPRLVAIAAGLAGLALAGAPARAETLHVAGVYPAESDGAAALDRIAVETFGGVDGAAVSIGISDRLRNLRIGGERYFTIVPAGMGSHADGVLRGTAAALVRRERFKARRNRCTDMDGNGKCLKRRDVEVRCIRRTIRLGASIRLVADNGNLLYASEEPVTQADSYCPGGEEHRLQPVEDVVRALAARLAQKVRVGIAPVERAEDIRVMENRKHLARDLQPRFKNAVHLTKHDPAAACREWGAIDQASPHDLSTVFDLGLCAESRGDMGAAEQRYREALSLDPGNGYSTAGLHRVEDRMRADHQLAAHHGA